MSVDRITRNLYGFLQADIPGLTNLDVTADRKGYDVHIYFNKDGFHSLIAEGIGPDSILHTVVETLFAPYGTVQKSSVDSDNLCMDYRIDHRR